MDNLFVSIEKELNEKGFYYNKFRIAPKITNLIKPVYEIFDENDVRITADKSYFYFRISKLEECEYCEHKCS